MSEPIIIPSDYERLIPWFNMLRRINSTIVCGSLQWIEIGVFIDQDGLPQFWTAAERRTLDPKNREIEIRD